MELWQELITIERQLNDALATLRKNGIDYCEANRLYQMEKAKTIMKLKSDGIPITLIPQMVKGLENVAELDYQRNKAEVIYKANVEAINIKKLELRVLEEQIEREWGNAKDN